MYNPEKIGWKKVKGKENALTEAGVNGKTPKKTENRKVWPVDGQKGWYWVSKVGGENPNLLQQKETEIKSFQPSQKNGQTKANKAIPMIAANA